jgi:NAD(P)-dependent dehydrogenase (short-subunit alcohol dehydrogenase family)
VLGASSGTGAAIARALAREPGLNVFGVHRGNHPEEAEALQAAIRGADRQVHLRVADAGTPAGAAEGAAELLAVAGPRSVSVFVHSIANASVGVLSTPVASRLHPRQLQKTMESMATSFVYWVQEMLSLALFAPSALILGLSNPMEDQVVTGTAAIASAKAALGVYVRHLARELGPLGHRVNLLKFGAVITPAVRRTFGEERLDRLTEVLHRAIPAGRLSTADEVAAFVSVLAGPSARWFNGATIDFTGAEAQGFFDTLLSEHSPTRKE